MKQFHNYLTTIFIVLACMGMSNEKAQKHYDNGYGFYLEQNYTEALGEYTLAMKQAQTDGNIGLYLRSLSSIATIYDVFANYPRAIYYYNKVISTPGILDEKELYATTVAKMVVCYCNAGDKRNAIKYLELQKTHPQKDKRLCGYLLLTNQGLVASLEHRPLAAANFYKKAIEYVKTNMMDGIYAAPLYNELGHEYMSLGKADSALIYIKECESIAKRQHLDGYLSDAYSSLANYYGVMGNKNLSEKYKKKFEEISDIAFSKHRIDTESNKLLMAQDEISDRKISTLAETVNTQNIAITAFAILIMSLIGTIVVILRQQHRQKKSYELLIHKDEEIESLSDIQPIKTTKSLAISQAECLLGKISEVMKDPKFIFNPDFSLTMLCKEVGSNTKYVSMVINETYKKNFKTLLNEKRVREATRRMLDDENYEGATIQTIALSVGYSSSTSFILAFKKIKGMTPAVYKSIKNSKGSQ